MNLITFQKILKCLLLTPFACLLHFAYFLRHTVIVQDVCCLVAYGMVKAFGTQILHIILVFLSVIGLSHKLQTLLVYNYSKVPPYHDCFNSESAKQKLQQTEIAADDILIFYFFEENKA